MKMLYFEMRKSWLRIPIFIALIVMSALSVFKLNGECRTANIRRTGEGKEWYWRAYKQYCGEISNEKIADFRAISDTISAQYNSGNYSAEYNDKYITGYLAGDYVLLNIDIKREIAYAVTYPNISNVIAARAYENIELYNKNGMNYEAKRNYLIYHAYQNRSIPEYRTTLWAEIFFNYDFSLLLCVIMLVAGLSPCFTNEKESGMETLIIAANKKTQTDITKISSAAVYCAILSVYFAVSDMISLHFLVGVDGLNMPVYSVETFQKSPFGFSLLWAILVWVFTRFISLFFFSLIILFISKITPNTILSIAAGFASLLLLT
ncbi:MAG: hypothetical protein K2N56_12055, partial [Oscillospiraceae bacterium]|nr:hypothetical protein [Oscillospiraceae bacterium]